MRASRLSWIRRSAADYVKAFWNVAIWEDVQNRYAAATSKAQGLIF